MCYPLVNGRQKILNCGGILKVRGWGDDAVSVRETDREQPAYGETEEDRVITHVNDTKMPQKMNPDKQHLATLK